MNKHQPHVYVIPEDDSDRQIANGFVLHNQVDGRRIQVVPPPGGWLKVLETFRNEYIPRLRQYNGAHVVLLIDFDHQVERRKDRFKTAIHDEFKARVFLIGSQDEPETLRNALNASFEEIGKSLAEDCSTGNSVTWDHEQLRHNEEERQRLVQIVKPFLF